MIPRALEPTDPARPFWSVMLPVYRPQPDFFRQALESVLQQDAGAARMEITVVDNASPDGDVEGLVRAIGGERVAYVRNATNLGMARGWNECIRRARGRWVHLLHHDDYILPGFYERLEAAAGRHPEVSLMAVRARYIKGCGATICDAERLVELEQGGRDVAAFFYTTPLQCPGVVITKAFYEAHGGFRTDMTFVLDCEMWTRAISTGGGLVLPEVLCAYRINEANESSRLARTAADLIDYEKLHQLFTERHPGFEPARARRLIIDRARKRLADYQAAGDREAVAAHRAFLNQQVGWLGQLAYTLTRHARAIKRSMVSQSKACLHH